MSIHRIRPQKTFGSETEMVGAPSVTLRNGNRVTPQHYFRFDQTLESLRAILVHVECHPSILLFADKEAGNLYIQASIVGQENYPQSVGTQAKKLVYGRKWLIRGDTPTSEIIQTAFLAIKKIREHEVRELLTLKDTKTGRHSAIFSSHQDLPLMADNRQLLANQQTNGVAPLSSIVEVLELIRFDKRRIRVIDILQRSNNVIVDIALEAQKTPHKPQAPLTEFNELELSLVLKNSHGQLFLYELMEALIAHSDRFVAETFSYKGFTRFSWDNSPSQIANLSITTRPYTRDMKNARFAAVFKHANFQTDAARTPPLGQGPLAEKNRQILTQFKALEGHMPDGFLASHHSQQCINKH